MATPFTLNVTGQENVDTTLPLAAEERGEGRRDIRKGKESPKLTNKKPVANNELRVHK